MSEFGKDFKTHVLLGDYTYQYDLSAPDKSGCCTVKFTVDEKYDFQGGKPATFRTVQTRSAFGIDVEVTAVVKLPDSVMVLVKDATGARDFERITKWTETFCVKKPPASKGGGGSPDKGR